MTAQLLGAPDVAAPLHRTAVRPAVPRTATSIFVMITVVSSLAPGLLPRSSSTQAIVTAVAAALGLALAAVTHRAVSTVWTPPVHLLARRIALCTSVTAIIAATVVDARWQNELRAAMGAAPTSAMHWVEMWCGAVSICAIAVVTGVGLARGAGRLGPIRTICSIIVIGLAGYLAVLPATVSSFTERFEASNTFVDASLTVPLSPGKSGSGGSLIGWDDLGREGRKFASGGAEDAAVRTYVPLTAASTAQARARIAVDELERSGGFTKSHIVIAVPTGSGWIDENAVSGAEDRFDGDVATVALQYSYQPSWATFLFAKSEAKDSADALLDAVLRRIGDMPESTRPALYVYGQSLGSIGGSAAVEAHSGPVCGALWAGPPAGQVVRGDAVVLANTSDPVVRWSSALIAAPPDLSFARVDAPMPRWIPVVSYVQTAVDLISALDAPAGHGHRYGTDQGQLPDC
ncbi:alpha/beta-hydrolase family protein [Rhodococcoides yunnanense]|uniref:alpha/beta-hydrolase family protein n=1 Tax=Rhodococcoides yunnanense TaxID=278209 RepID=UPI00093517F8|nr:alpha/beta-hydrolase family protein [Rhodococcus yunnanensis]